MSIQKAIIFSSFVVILSTPCFSQIPSICQSTWHGGIQSTDYPYEFDPYFLEETGTAWQSAGRLSLSYPILNQSIYYGLPQGKQAEAADFTGDGFPDLIIITSLPDSDVILLENPGASSISSEEWNSFTIASSFMQCQSISSEDIDNDGDIDVVIGCYGSAGISWLENPGSPVVWQLHSIESILGISSVDCGDMDQDGDPDILFCSASRDTLGWMNNLDGVGESWSRETICSTINYPFYAAITDLDSDGVPDVSACYRLEDQVYWFKKNPSDGTWTRHAIASVPQAASLSAGDCNGDSFIDILACGLVENSVFLCTSIDGSGTTWNTENLDLNTSAANSCLFLDLENDGDLDIAVSDQSQDSVIILSSLDASGQNWFKTTPFIDDPVFLLPADFDTNGTSEISCLSKSEMRILSADPACFSTNGILTSIVASVPATTDDEWGNIIWDSWEPPGTTIGFQLRNSDYPENMGEWSDTIITNGTYLGDIFQEVGHYIQYRVFLSSDLPDTSPFLYSIDLEGVIGEIHNCSEGMSKEPLVIVSRNPALESITATIKPYTGGTRELMVYDVSGRLVVSQSYEPANCSVTETIEGLSPGMYHILVIAGEQRETLKVCIIY